MLQHFFSESRNMLLFASGMVAFIIAVDVHGEPA
jgi:hypothetical protein